MAGSSVNSVSRHAASSWRLRKTSSGVSLLLFMTPLRELFRKKDENRNEEFTRLRPRAQMQWSAGARPGSPACHASPIIAGAAPPAARRDTAHDSEKNSLLLVRPDSAGRPQSAMHRELAQGVARLPDQTLGRDQRPA